MRLWMKGRSRRREKEQKEKHTQFHLSSHPLAELLGFFLLQHTRPGS